MSRRKQKQKLRRRRKRHGRSSCTVYGLCDSEGKLRYIGQTRQILPARLSWFYNRISQKRSQAKRLSPVEQWLDELNYFGIKPTIVPIDEAATWDVSEIIYIERYRAAGYKLLNVLRGGNDNLIASNASRDIVLNMEGY